MLLDCMRIRKGICVREDGFAQSFSPPSKFLSMFLYFQDHRISNLKLCIVFLQLYLLWCLANFILVVGLQIFDTD